MTPANAFRWHKSNAPVPSSRTGDIFFSTPTVGWAVNSNGQVLKTTDNRRVSMNLLSGKRLRSKLDGKRKNKYDTRETIV
jgi:hypothetical protein